MISKTQIDKKMKRKTNPNLVETIFIAKKNNLLDLAKELAKPTKQQIKINLNKLNELKENNIMVVGKVLGEGNIEKKIKISALSFSESAKEKLKKASCEIKTIQKEIKDNVKLKGVKII